ncbi:hypothetical protein BGZ98_004013 [Dissophora globulifera]|nr:hypothetical protein BGZ98_004013 [Dissophora globulifera]
MAPVWLCCQINSVADANDEDQGVVGGVYNVSLQLGAPIGIAISNIIANTRNSPTAVGVELLPGYRSAFYAVSIMGGIGLVLTIILASNTDPVKLNEESTTAKTDDMDIDTEIGGSSTEALDEPDKTETALGSEIEKTEAIPAVSTDEKALA